MAIPFLILLIPMARRKGKDLALYIILAIIPGVNILAALWLASQTDASVNAEIAELKRRLDEKDRPPKIPPV
jgi:hypothetical protein